MALEPSTASPMEPLLVMKIDNYEVYRDDTHELGSGSYGTVYMGKCLKSETDVAVKRLRLGDESTEEGREWNAKYVDGEVKALKEIEHDNIVKLHDWKRRGPYMYLFMELCLEGNLNDYVLKIKKLSQMCSFRFMQQIASALEYLHSKNVIHRDIKPGNILVTKHVESKECVIKVTDFGTAREIPSSSAPMTLTLWGSPNWMAPEVYPDKDGRVHYNNQSDTFSSGVLYLSLVDHEKGKPLKARKEQGMSLGDWMRTQEKPVKMPVITKEGDDKHKLRMKRLITNMISPEPSDRCSMKFVCDFLQTCDDALQLEVVHSKACEDNSRLQNNAQKAQNKIVRLQNNAQQAKNENFTLTRELQQTRQQLSLANNTIQRTKTENSRLTEQLQTSDADREELQTKLDRANIQVAGVQKLIGHRDQELLSLNSELATTKANHESTTRLLAKAQDTISRIGLPRKVAILRYKQMFSKITKEKAIEDIEYDLRKRISDRACSIEYPVKIYSLQPYGKCNIARGYGEAVVVNFSEYQDALKFYIEAKESFALCQKVLLLQPDAQEDEGASAASV